MAEPATVDMPTKTIEADAAEAAEPKAPFDLRKLIAAIIKLILASGILTAASAGTTYLMRPAAPDVPVAEIVVKDVKTRTGVPVELVAETTGAKVRWRAVTPGLLLIDDLPDLVNNKKALAFACSAGVYYVECWSAISNAPTAIYTAKVTIGDGPEPLPVPPGPGPEPKPPTPPVPPPPAPISPLGQKLQAAYAGDAAIATVKAGQKMLLMGLYEAMIEHAKNEQIATTSDLLADMKNAANGLVAPGALIEMRKVISAEIAAALGTETGTKLDAPTRAKAVDVFQRVAKALGEVK